MKWILLAPSTLLGASAAVFCLAAPVLAHHGFETEYDNNNVVEATGVVSKIEWTNPHMQLFTLSGPPAMRTGFALSHRARTRNSTGWPGSGFGGGGCASPIGTLRTPPGGTPGLVSGMSPPSLPLFP